MTTIVAVTACPTGIAHTHLAAEALKATATARGHTIRIERQSAEGVEDTLQPAEIAAADVVIVAADIHVDTTRFAGKPVHSVSTSKAIRQTDAVLDAALSLIGEETPTMTTETPKPSAPAKSGLKVVAITACPTGIAHTFMAADALKKAAAAKGYEIAVETQGSVGAKTPLTDEDVAAADLVVIAADTHVDDSR